MEVIYQIIPLKILLSCAVALCATVFSIILLQPIAAKIGLEDTPGGRKQHKSVTPVIGGICMFIGFVFGLLTIQHSLQIYRGFFAASALLVFVGVLDDLHELSTKTRFYAQILAAILMAVWGQTVIHSFGDLLFLGNIELGFLAIPITIFATVGAINAVNMIDGVDGLLGSLALIQFGLLAYIAYISGFYASFTIVALFIAVLVAYLIFNFPIGKQKCAKVFMGDAGSMLIGFALTWFFINLTQQAHSVAKPVTMLWIFAIPLFDTTYLLIKRTLQYKSPLKPGRDHLHHLLINYNLSSWQISLLVSLLSLVLGIMGIIFLHSHVAQGTQFLIFLLLFFIYSLLISGAWRCQKKQAELVQNLE